MIPQFRIAASWTFIAILLGLSSSAALADCQSWLLPAKFNAVEDSGFFVVFDLKKINAAEYRGSVYYNDWNANREVRGRATAKLDGAKLDIAAEWVTTPTGGGQYTYYNGSISDGVISGLRKNPLLREGDKNREVFWKSRQTATCASTARPGAGDSIKDKILKQQAQEASKPPPTRPNAQRSEQNVDRQGGDYRRFEVPIERYQSCLEACEADGKCKAYTYVRAGWQGSKGVCWLKDRVPAKSANRCCVSGALR